MASVNHPTFPPPVASDRILSDTTDATDFSTESQLTEKIPTTAPAHTVIPLTDCSSDDGDKEFELPPKRSYVKRAYARPILSVYRRLVAVVVLINIALFVTALVQGWYNNLPAVGYLLIGNLFLAILVRQQRFINLLFSLASLTRTHLPLSVRWSLGKIYHFGGVHAGASICATLWLLFFTVSATVLKAQQHENASSELTLFLSYLLILLLVVIVLLALPKFRSKFHNSFEATHRFLGWTSLGLVWVHTVFLIRDFQPENRSLAYAFFTSPTPYLLFFITLSVASTWIHLRKVPVTITKPSDHAVIAQFDNLPRLPFPGSSTAISISPLYEWHSFANIPKPNEKAFRLIISRAGDWTSAVIDKPPTHFWIRGIPTAGVANIETLFHRVLYVCTGSGIGPILPHLIAKHVPSRLFWSTRSPVDTYGQALVDEILEASPDAVIHDTKKCGKPDMVAKSYQLARQSDAEAVIIISNQKLTRKVVYGMESRGIPAYGAIWDS